jgi:kynurenine 3-monooxygenase
MGDAAHGIVPFYGQGLNACFEDGLLLLNEWKQAGSSPCFYNIFSRYQEKRKRETEAIRVMAYDNFLEMRDLTADPHFLYFKQIEQKMMSLFPQDFFSQYYLVTFTDVPYDHAKKIGEIQKELIGKAIENMSHHSTHPTVDQLPIDFFEQIKTQYLQWETQHFPSPHFKNNLQQFL